MSEAPAPVAPVETPAAPAEPAKPATLQDRRAALDAKPAPKAEEKPPEAKPEAKPPEKPAPKADDDLARLVAEDRRIKSEAKKIEAERAKIAAEAKEFEQDRARILAAREAIKKGDRVAAIKAMFPDEDLTTDVVWDLLKSATADEPKELDPDKIAALAVERFKAEQKAERDAAEAKRREAIEAQQRELSEAQGEYLGVVTNHYAANAKEFPAMGRLAKQIGENRAGRVIGEAVLEAFDEYRKANPGKFLTPAQALAAVEKQLRGDEAEAAAEAPKPVTTSSSAYRSDPGRPPAPPAKPKTLQDRRAELMRSDGR